MKLNENIDMSLSSGMPLRSHFPLFLPAAGKKVLVVGGGTIATRRIRTLCRFDWQVTVVAPELTEEAQSLAEEGRILWEKREFRPEDVAGMFLVVAATDCREVNRLAGEAAKQQGIFVSVADSREECTFFFPAIAENSYVVAGIAGDGSSHKETACSAEKVRKALQQEDSAAKE